MGCRNVAAKKYNNIIKLYCYGNNFYCHTARAKAVKTHSISSKEKRKGRLTRKY